jgi:hypothetical protein
MIGRAALAAKRTAGRIAIVLTPAGRNLFVMWTAYWDGEEFEAFGGRYESR